MKTSTSVECHSDYEETLMDALAWVEDGRWPHRVSLIADLIQRNYVVVRRAKNTGGPWIQVRLTRLGTRTLAQWRRSNGE